MKVAAIIGSLFAATASAAALRGRQSQSYSVSDFHASCIPHSVLCSYEFDVVASSAMFPTNCSLLLQGPDYLPLVEPTGCENPAYAWSVATAGNGSLALTVTSYFNSRTNLTGTHVVTPGQLVAEQHGAVISQRYTGPANFSMKIVGTEG